MSGAILAKDARIAIVGGGVGGLTLAAALQQVGWTRVSVFEQWCELKTRGGAISMMPENLGGSQGVLETLGLWKKVNCVGHPINQVSSTSSSGRTMDAKISLGSRIMREALQRTLHDALTPGTVRFGMSLSEFRERGDEVDLVFEDSSCETFDLLVAADGINSTVASCLFPLSKKEFSGFVVYLCLAHGAHMPEGAFYERHVDCGDRGFCLRACPSTGFDGRWDMAAFTVRSTSPVSNAWDSEGTRNDVEPLVDALKQRGDCPDWLEPLISQSSRVMKWGIYESEPRDSWISQGGRVVLMGDAAHAMAPFLGLGAQSAMLDAQSLAGELNQEQPLTQALQQYERLRRGPCERITRMARVEGLGITSFGLTAKYRSVALVFLRPLQVILSAWSGPFPRKLGTLLGIGYATGLLVCETLSNLLLQGSRWA